MTAILGISAFYHDSAAALIVDGKIVAAVQEERFSRVKYDAEFPARAIAYCLAEAGLTPEQLDYVAFYDKPLTKFERLLETYLAYAPAGFSSFRQAIPVWLKRKLYTHRTLRRGLNGAARSPLVFLDHHESHAASAFFPSPFEEAAILTLDGVGEWTTTAFGTGVGNQIRLTHRLQFPHSLGLLYSAFTYYCGFKVNSGEYKLMGLAPYGQPIYRDAICKHLIDLKPDGSFWLNMDYFNYCQGLTMTNRRFHDLFGGPPRKPDSTIEPRHMDLAASIQAVTEEVLLRAGRELHRRTGMKNLVLAGGVALNCVANGRLLREGPYESIWIQPAAGDAGGALGAALFVWYQLLGKPRETRGQDAQQGSFLGPRYTSDAIRQFLEKTGAVGQHFPNEADLLDHVARLLAEEKVVGWFHGRTEFGPRALGARSILGDARSPKMQAVMNLKIKFREGFRPFAPVVLREHVHEWFGMRPGEDAPYMLLIAPVREEHRVPRTPEEVQHGRDPDLVRRVNQVRSSVPAITHVDYSARVQTIDERHGRFRRLLRRFYERTGCPILVNTSFNLSWEPIVLTPQEAYHTFMQSEMDVLVLEDYVLHKEEQPLGLRPWGSAGARRVADPASPWADPATGTPLVVTPSCAHNPVTGLCYPVEDGIPRLFVPAGAPAASAGCGPFPSYDDLETPRDLLERLRRSPLVRLLNEQLPYGARVLEVGCGTGQLTNFLAIARRSALGVDISLEALRLAQAFKTAHDLERATFAHMNPLCPGLREDFFDVVLLNGLRHTVTELPDVYQRVARLVKPDGYLVVSLGNYYGRKWSRLANAARSCWPRRRGSGENGKSAAPLEFGLYPDSGGEPTRGHTLDEVLAWMTASGIRYVNSLPGPRGGSPLAAAEDLFASQRLGSRVNRFLSQVTHACGPHGQGTGLTVIGQRR